MSSDQSVENSQRHPFALAKTKSSRRIPNMKIVLKLLWFQLNELFLLTHSNIVKQNESFLVSLSLDILFTHSLLNDENSFVLCVFLN